MGCCSSNQTNSCNNACGKPRCTNGYLLIIVLYILLAIIVGSYIC